MTAVLPLLVAEQYASRTAKSSSGMSKRTSAFPSCATYSTFRYPALVSALRWSGRESDSGTAPLVTRSISTARVSPNTPPEYSFFRRYPNVVPHRLANRACSAGVRVFKYACNVFMVTHNTRGYCASQYPRVNYFGSYGLHNSDMNKLDKYTIRQERLQSLIDGEPYNGVYAKFAKATGIDASYVSRMLYPEGKKGRKRIGEDIVEKINAAHPGWETRNILAQMPEVEYKVSSVTQDLNALNNSVIEKLCHMTVDDQECWIMFIRAAANFERWKLTGEPERRSEGLVKTRRYGFGVKENLTPEEIKRDGGKK